MTPERDILTILANLSPHAPRDLDATLFGKARTARTCTPVRAQFPPSRLLWQRSSSDPTAYIGVRVRGPVSRPELLAARLASIALERKVIPVFLSYVGKTPMQRFGFRVEQLSGLSEDAQEQQETELARFWNFVMVVEASELAQLR